MKQRKYIDFYASVGRKNVPDKDYPFDKNTLLNDMKYSRVHGAIVFPNEADSYSFVYGNKKGIELANENKRLKTLANVPTTWKVETADKNYIENLLESGVCGITITPSLRSFITPKNIESIANALIEHKRPLVIPDAYYESILRDVDNVAAAFPELNIVMKGCVWDLSRMVWDVLSHNGNVNFEISSFHINNLFQLTKEHLGIERVLYGTSWPIKSQGAMKAFVEYANISEKEKELVAHGNACRLFGLDENDFELYDDSECQFDSIALEIDSGKAISVPVIDSHTHMVASSDKTVNTCIMLYSDCDNIAEKMETMGVDAIITAPWSGIALDGNKANEEVIFAAKKHPGKFFGYSTCNIHYEEDFGNWREYHEKYPDIFVGIKPYPPFQKFEFDDEVCAPWFEYANEHHLTALIHASNQRFIDSIDNIADKYENVTFIMGHSLSNWDIARSAVKLAKKHSNVILEITYTTTGRGMIEYLVSEVGAERILYGSDLPMRDPAPQLGWVCYAKIPVEDKKKILAENIKNVLSKRKM